jgi:hypothetical protein
MFSISQTCMTGVHKCLKIYEATNILSTWKVTWIKFHTHDSQILGKTEKNLVSMETEFVHPFRLTN